MSRKLRDGYRQTGFLADHPLFGNMETVLKVVMRTDGTNDWWPLHMTPDSCYEPEPVAPPEAAKPEPIIRWKMLTKEGQSPFAFENGGTTLSYSLPVDGKPGDWLDVPGKGCFVAEASSTANASDNLCAGGPPKHDTILVKMECQDLRETWEAGLDCYNRVRILEVVPWEDCPSEEWKRVAKQACPELFAQPEEVKPPKLVPAGHEWTGEFRPCMGGEQHTCGDCNTLHNGHDANEIPRYILRKLPEPTPPEPGEWSKTCRWDGGEKRRFEADEWFVGGTHYDTAIRALSGPSDSNFHILIPLTPEELEAKRAEGVRERALAYRRSHGVVLTEDALVDFHNLEAAREK